jgi:hypothetical protein
MYCCINTFFSKDKKKIWFFFIENLNLALPHLPTKFQPNPPSYLGGDSKVSTDRQTTFGCVYGTFWFPYLKFSPSARIWISNFPILRVLPVTLVHFIVGIWVECSKQHHFLLKRIVMFQCRFILANFLKPWCGNTFIAQVNILSSTSV